MTVALAAERHVRVVTTMRARLTDAGAWMPARSTHGWSRDHRLVALWHRAKDRTQRRALLLLAAIDAATPTDELERLERLMVAADRLADRIGDLA